MKQVIDTNMQSEEWRFEERHVAESYIDLPLTCYEQKRPLTTQNNLRETDLINLSSVTSNLGSNKYCMEMLQTTYHRLLLSSPTPSLRF